MGYSVTINEVDRTVDVLFGTVKISDIINDQQNTCSFSMIDRSAVGMPELSQEIIITDENDVVIFGGYITRVTLDNKSTGEILAKVSCVDYAWILDQNLIHKTFEDMTDKEMIDDMVNTYCPGSGITTTGVVEGVTIEQMSFNYVQFSQCMRKLCDITGRNWYIDYNKVIHYFPLETDIAPFDIDDACTTYSGLTIQKDASQIKNRIYVRGGTKLSDSTTYSEKGDGAKRTFPLPDKPHDVSVTVNGVSKSLGIKNIHTSGYDWYLNYEEKYIEQDAGGTVLATSDELVVTYKYNIPILVAIENTASIAEYGQHEFAIFDKSITTTNGARDRAVGELTDYANSIIEGSFDTMEPGFISGQYININLSAYDVNDNYIVQSVTTNSMGAGLFKYNVKIASAKTLGIIRFLIELLEANKNLIELDSNEVVDELYNVTDRLLSDSLAESLTIDSCGAYFTWVEDSPAGTVSTRMRWNLFQWG